MGALFMTALPFRYATDFRGQPRCRHLIDCAGAQLHVHTRSLATVLRVDGEIDASNADLVGGAIRRYSQLKAPLILDLSELDFLGMSGFRTLLVLNCEHRRARLHWSVVSGARLDRLTRVVPNHGLPLVDSVPEALQLVDDRIQARRQHYRGAPRQHEPQRKTA
ncbi:STAS domain-containing protein [Mycobacterium sp. 050272]|uniref:STAS domain-containing protein n=1 Tax=Mycobacterium sp. 050272 TaxID=3142488 RepID=UPI00318A3DA8